MSSLNAIRLSQLAGAINDIIDEVFYSKAFWVIADVTSHKFKATSNYHYFELVEKDTLSNTILAKFATRAWTEGAERIAVFEQTTGQQFTNDINVLVLVSINYHPAYGLQLTLHDIDTNFTLGTLEKQKQATLLRLLEDNPEHVSMVDEQLVTFNQQLNLNRVIQRVAVVASSTSAGFEDFIHTIENNNHGYAFHVDNYFTVVQGENNARLVVDKLIEIYQSGISYDAVIIIRGGGAQTDLLLFEQYNIGRAIARFPIPVITGIGHQRNETVADLMAHKAVKTPTQAAEFIISHNKAFHDTILSLEKSIIIRSQQLIAEAARDLADFNFTIVNSSRAYLNQQKELLVRNMQSVINQSKSAVYKNSTALMQLSAQVSLRPRLLLHSKSSELGAEIGKLKLANRYYLKSQQGSLNQLRTMIKLMDPAQVLKKGFAIVKHDDKISRSGEDIAIGKDISIIFVGQEISATVNAKQPYNEEEFNLSAGL